MTTQSVARSRAGTPAPQGEFCLTEKDFAQVAAIIYEDSGINLPSSKSALVYSRLAKRLRTLGIASFKDYCAHVSGAQGASERVMMLAALTTNVTQFFREMHHFEYLKNDVLPPLLEAAKRGTRVRIWSAGCSNGSEPYSIAATLLSLLPSACDHDIRILASDIDPNIIEFARIGRYGDQAIEGVPTELRRRWFHRDGSDHVVHDDMRKLIAFRELNLNGSWPIKGTFQAIFCRNVTIYFDPPTRERLWNRFCDQLSPGGWLYLGHSERLSGQSAERMELCGTTAYRLKGREDRT